MTSKPKENKKLIAFLLPSLEVGGTQINMLRLAQGFQARGYAVELWSFHGSGTLQPMIPKSLFLRIFRGKRTLTALPGLLSTLRAQRPSVLQTGLTHLNLLACLGKLCSTAPFRLVLSERGNLLDSKSTIGEWKFLIMVTMMRLFYPIADNVIGVSDGVVNQLQKDLGIKGVTVTKIHSPILEPRSAQQIEYRCPHPWLVEERSKRDIPVIVAAGRLEKVKDFGSLITAVSLLAGREEIRLIILGEGSLRHRLEELAKSLGVAHAVDFPGIVSKPVSYFFHSNCVVLSSVTEGLPSVLVQALDVGAPVVSTDCPFGPRELLENGERGLLVEVGNPEQLANAISASLRLDRGPMSPRYLDSFRMPNSVANHIKAVWPESYH